MHNKYIYEQYFLLFKIKNVNKKLNYINCHFIVSETYSLHVQNCVPMPYFTLFVKYNLILKNQRKNLLQVSIVFHSAATLKFDEELQKAVEQNVLSVIRLMDICDKLPNIEVSRCSYRMNIFNFIIIKNVT